MQTLPIPPLAPPIVQMERLIYITCIFCLEVETWFSGVYNFVGDGILLCSTHGACFIMLPSDMNTIKLSRKAPQYIVCHFTIYVVVRFDKILHPKQTLFWFKHLTAQFQMYKIQWNQVNISWISLHHYTPAFLFVVLPIKLWVLPLRPVSQKRLSVKHYFIIFSGHGLWLHSALRGLKIVN
jgi:hypothetical protein